MMEHTTDRLFWTLTSVIVGALILTLGINAFPKATQSTLQTFSGITRQADTATGHASDAASEAINDANGQSDGLSTNQTSNDGSTNNDTSGNKNSNTSQQATDPDAQAKASAVEASTLGFKVTANGDGTGVLNGYTNDMDKRTTLNIPEYVKVNGQITKITSIADLAFASHGCFTSVNIPNGVTTIGKSAFYNNDLTSVSIPNSVTNIGWYAFNTNQLTTVNIPNKQGLQSAVSNSAFDLYGPYTKITNNPSN